MPELPTIRLGRHQVTRLMIGGNPFCGNSHFSEELNREMADYFTAENVVKALQAAQAAGINTVQARGDYHRVLHWIELFRRTGGRLHWIAQTASEMHDLKQNIRILAAADAIAVYHHGTNTDRHWFAGKMDVVRDRLKYIRDQGLLVGLGTHMPEVITFVEEHGWDIDFYMACFYNISTPERQSALVTGRPVYQEETFRPEDPAKMCQVIRATAKPCIAFKILGANRRCGTRDEVRAAFEFAFANIKPIDAVCVGMYPRHIDQIRENVGHTLAALSRGAAS